jgi:hypothetical protein
MLSSPRRGLTAVCCRVRLQLRQAALGGPCRRGPRGRQLWLDRARAFAMHAIDQSNAEASAVGRRRATLWTGDIGLAAYVADCIDGRCRFPSLEFDA